MGVEPTRATSAAPLNGFEDRGAHQDSATPLLRIHRILPFAVIVNLQAMGAAIPSFCNHTTCGIIASATNVYCQKEGIDLC